MPCLTQQTPTPGGLQDVHALPLATGLKRPLDGPTSQPATGAMPSRMPQSGTNVSTRRGLLSSNAKHASTMSMPPPLFALTASTAGPPASPQSPAEAAETHGTSSQTDYDVGTPKPPGTPPRSRVQGAATGFESYRIRVEDGTIYTVMIILDHEPFPFTDENALKNGQSRSAAGPRLEFFFFGSCGSLGTACAVATRAIGLPVIAAGTSPYIEVMLGLHNRCRLFIIRTPTSGEAAPVNIGDASNYVNIMTTGETLPGMAAPRISPPTAIGDLGQST